MRILNLNLINFRNYGQINFDFDDQLNIICGSNGVGKTNIVEAIYLLALTKSFRISKDKYLIKKDLDIAKISGDFFINNDRENFKITLNKEEKIAEINNNKIMKFSDYISRIFVVLFYPHDTEIINESPSERRKILNIEISQLYREYINVLNDYNKLLKQRNSYIRQLYLNANLRTEYLDILTRKLIMNGKIIYNYRKKFIEEINDKIGEYYLKIFNNGILNIKYVSEFSKDEVELFNLFKKNLSKEMALGKTLLGVHHDDFNFVLDGNNLREWGSQGQMKNAILSFKLSEIDIVKSIKGENPILILDDLFSELDDEKINNIFNLLNKDVQTFITATNINNKSLTKIKNKKIINLDIKLTEEV